MQKTSKEDYTRAIGIDLGTTNSCVGVFKNGKVEVIANKFGNRIMPSMVSFTNAERLIGESAKANAIINPTNTIYGVKRLMGRKYRDKSVQQDMKRWPFRVVKDWLKIKIAVTYKKKEKTFTPQQISAMILSKLKETAETYLEDEVIEAVITVPAYFNDSQRKATMDAGKIAGLKVLSILNEPTAAAIAYGMDKKIVDERNILVYDFGGGTFDVSIMTIKKGNFKVRAVAGDTHLGGEDISDKLVDYIVEDFQRKHRRDISTNMNVLPRLRKYCEEAKILLSSQQATKIDIENLVAGIDYSTTITRVRFEQLNEDLFMKTIKQVQLALDDAKMTQTDIHNIVLVGGSTRIPKVQSLLEEFFRGKKLSKGINLDEAVAYGAAVQAAILKGDRCEMLSDLKINDVTPFSLGIEIGAGKTCVLIKRNTATPVKHTRTFRTDAGKDEFKVNVCEGEHKLFKDNNFLGHFVLKGFPASKKGVDVEVTFDIDAKGIMTVSAFAPRFGAENKIKITNDQARLTNDAISIMARKEHKYKANDEKQQKSAPYKAHLEDYICNIESGVAEDYRNNIGRTDKQKVLDLCKTISAWLDNDQHREVEDYLAKEKQLEHIWIPILTKLNR